MTDEERELLEQYSDDELNAAADWSKIPFFGEGMASGHVGKARQQMGKIAEDLIADVDLPQFDPGDYGKYSLVGEYDPTMAEYETITEDPRVLELEMEALERLASENGAAGEMGRNARYRNALMTGRNEARGREDAIRMQSEASGQAGGTMDSVMRAQGSQIGANRATQGAMDAEHMAALEKLANEQALMGATSNVRGNNFRTAAANAKTINDFNMFNTGLANEAAKLNLNAQQNISNANVDAGNKSMDRRDGNTQRTFDNAMGKATSRGNAIQGMSNAAQQSQNASATAGRARDENMKDTVAAIYGLFGGGGGK